MLLHRVLTAANLLAVVLIVLLAVYLGGWYLAGATAAIAALGLRELYRLLAARVVPRRKG